MVLDRVTARAIWMRPFPFSQRGGSLSSLVGDPARFRVRQGAIVVPRPPWRGLVLFLWTVFPGGSGLMHGPREKRQNPDVLPFFRSTSDNFSWRESEVR